MFLIGSLQKNVRQLTGAGSAVSAHYGEDPRRSANDPRERIVLFWAWLTDDNIVGTVEKEGQFVNAELVPGFTGYGPVRFYGDRH
ncbi:MAG TPA: hypothetical protein VFR68_15150 [Candidatus Dormibacteraeota bacterium]|nr:hypothetical protein [Candidatus Dormibacteraeota bacterium]